MNKTLSLCWACESLVRQAYDLKKVAGNQYRPKEKVHVCDYCKKRSVMMDTFEVTPKRRREDAGA